MLTQGMWMGILRDCCVCAYHVDSLSDWAWTLQFICKMACDGLCIVVAQWDQANHHHAKCARNTSAIHIQFTNKSLHGPILPNKVSNKVSVINFYRLIIFMHQIFINSANLENFTIESFDLQQCIRTLCKLISLKH